MLCHHGWQFYSRQTTGSSCVTPPTTQVLRYYYYGRYIGRSTATLPTPTFHIDITTTVSPFWP
jgi:hypothetical protein